MLIGAALAAPPWQAARAQVDAQGGGGAVVVVARATTACFSDMVRVTGVVVPRNMAVVNVDNEGFKITEVMAAEGNQVSAGQVIANLTRPAAPANPAVQGPAGAARPAATMTLKSPVNGLVTRSTARIGAVASPQASEPLFAILVDNEVELEVDVPGVHITKLKLNDPARVTIGNAFERPGRVRQVFPDINQRTQLGRARVVVGSDSAFRIGMFGHAVIDASRSCGVSIPRAAVDYRTDGTTVQVVRGRTVETRRVVIGLLSDDSAEIREGIKEGDIIVAHAGTSLHDGDKIKPMMSGDVEATRGLR